MKTIGLFKSIQSWGLGTERHKANFPVVYLWRAVFMQNAASPLTNFQEANIFNFFFFWLDHDKQKINGCVLTQLPKHDKPVEVNLKFLY